MHADTLFLGGPVFTGEGAPVSGLAVAVRDGRITAVVDDQQADAYRGPDTRVVDLAGALLSPGFQDAHVHPIGAGIELLQCNLSDAQDARDAARLVREYAEQNPDEPWILGGGWSMDHFPGGAPPRGLLDEATGDRPAFLHSRDHHSVWVNTAAIRAAGLTADTPDPADGRIEREPDGFPAGTLHEGAGELLAHVVPQVTNAFALAGLLRAQDELLSLGVTGWQDAWVEDRDGALGPLSAYTAALEAGELRAHAVAAMWWDRNRGLEQIEDIIATRDAWRSRGLSDRLDLGTVKMMVDGVAENFTASMLEPYLDRTGARTCNHGLSFIPRDILVEAVTRLDAAGIQVHFHALGDRAVRDALDAVEAARLANGPSDHRHHLAHLQLVAEGDVPRFVELGAVANLQMLWATHEPQLDELTLPFLAEDAVNRHYPFGEMHRAGVRLAAGSDWPVSSADPLEAIGIAVTRVAPGGGTPPLGGEHQRLDVETAFTAYTSGSAFVNRREHDTGRIEPGFLANLVTISPDPFAAEPDRVHESVVTSTWVGGDEVFTRTA